jgi:hypothetical protein
VQDDGAKSDGQASVVIELQIVEMSRARIEKVKLQKITRVLDTPSARKEREV